MKVKRRFPFVLLTLVLVLALLVTGLVSPGFALPLFYPKDEGPVGTDALSERQLAALAENALAPDGTVLPTGKSAAFSIEPVAGITISAEEDALDKDRTFRMEEVSEAQYAQLEDSLCEHIGPQLVVGAWELDAGLADDEMLPGTYQMTYDLKALGVPQDLYESVRAYRVDDKGVIYEYVHGIEGDALTIESRQNSISVLSIVIGSMIVAGAVKVIDKAATGAFQIDALHGSVKVPVDGKVRYEILLDLSYILKVIEKEGVQKAENEARQRAQKIVLEKINLRLGTEYKQPYQIKDPQIKADFNGWAEKECARLLKEDDAYQTQRRQIEEAASMSAQELREQLEQIRKIKEYYEYAYYYLKDVHKLKMPTYVMMVHLSQNAVEGGVAYDPCFGNPYMVLMIENMFSSGREWNYEELLLTIVHEHFHVCQREYIRDYYASYKFDEASAQTIEYEALEHFYPEKIHSMDHAANIRNRAAFVYGLDKYKMKYPEGTAKAADSANVSYPMAWFILYLRKADDKDFGQIMSSYGKMTWPSISTVLKGAYGLTDEELTEKWLAFAEEQKDAFHTYAKTCENRAFTPYTDLTHSQSCKKIEVYNNDYTIRMRQFLISRPDADDENDSTYCLLLRMADDYDDIMNDYRIIPIGRKEGGDYRKWKHGLFFEEHAYPSLETDESVQWFLEADGGTGGYWKTKSSYTVYVMRAPKAPECKVVDEKIRLDFPDLPVTGTKDGWFTSGEPELIDSYVVTFRLEKTILLQKQVKREELDALKKKGKPYELEAKELTVDGKPLTQAQKDAVEVVIQECADGTYETDKCFGPGSKPRKVWDDIDIAGEWDVTASVGEYSMDWLDQIVGYMPEEMQEYKDLHGSIVSEVAGSESRGVMTITPMEGMEKLYDASLVYQNEDGSSQPAIAYKGIWDPQERTLTLTPKDSQDLTGQIVLQVSRNETGGVVFETEVKTAEGLESFIQFQAILTGVKREGEAPPA